MNAGAMSARRSLLFVRTFSGAGMRVRPGLTRLADILFPLRAAVIVAWLAFLLGVSSEPETVSFDEIFSTLQIYMGSAYVNDFVFGTRTYRVYVQADKEFRSEPRDLESVTASDAGDSARVTPSSRCASTSPRFARSSSSRSSRSVAAARRRSRAVRIRRRRSD